MSIGDVFSKAFELWKRDVLWLVLAAFVVGIIMVAIFIVATLIVVAVGGAAFGLSGGGDSFTGVSAGVLVVGVIVYIIALFVVAAVAMTFYGGVFEMVIGAAKENRPVRFGDLFSGFRKFNSYLVYALVMAGIGIGMVILAVTIIGIPVAIILGIWISVIWLYVLPLIADRGLTFGDAQAQSRQMVKDVGWWKTFGMVVLLEVAIWVVLIIFQLITSPLGSDPESAGYVVRNIVYAVVQAFVVPFAVCYIAVMYLGSGGAATPAIADGGLPPAPPAGPYAVPPAPPAPPQGPVTSSTPVTTPVAPPVPVTPEAPAPPVTIEAAVPASVAATEESADEDAGTAVTQSEPGGDVKTDVGNASETIEAEAAEPDAPRPPVTPPEAPPAPNNPPVPPPLS